MPLTNRGNHIRCWCMHKMCWHYIWDAFNLNSWLVFTAYRYLPFAYYSTNILLRCRQMHPRFVIKFRMRYKAAYQRFLSRLQAKWDPTPLSAEEVYIQSNEITSFSIGVIHQHSLASMHFPSDHWTKNSLPHGWKSAWQILLVVFIASLCSIDTSATDFVYDMTLLAQRKTHSTPLLIRFDFCCYDCFGYTFGNRVFPWLFWWRVWRTARTIDMKRININI